MEQNSKTCMNPVYHLVDNFSYKRLVSDEKETDSIKTLTILKYLFYLEITNSLRPLNNDF